MDPILYNSFHLIPEWVKCLLTNWIHTWEELGCNNNQRVSTILNLMKWNETHIEYSVCLGKYWIGLDSHHHGLICLQEMEYIHVKSAFSLLVWKSILFVLERTYENSFFLLFCSEGLKRRRKWNNDVMLPCPVLRTDSVLLLLTYNTQGHVQRCVSNGNKKVEWFKCLVITRT